MMNFLASIACGIAIGVNRTEPCWPKEQEYKHTRAFIVLYEIAKLPFGGPPIHHAAFRFKRDKPQPYEFDAGWDRNGFYTRIEDRIPIHTIEITSTNPDILLRSVDEAMSHRWSKKCYDMLEDNCTDFVHEILMMISHRGSRGQWKRELGMLFADNINNCQF